MELIIRHKDYNGEPLDIEGMADEPYKVFEQWYHEAYKAEVEQLNGMYVATASEGGMPNVRTVLLRGFDEKGFVFMTNYRSQKGEEIKSNNQGALLFYWGKMNRQVRAQGTFEQMPPEYNQEYFQSRPRGAQIAATASSQSQEIGSKEALAAAFKAQEEVMEGKEIVCPDHWGGYRLVPSRYEFWSGQVNRLHDRVLYTKEGNGWKKSILYP